MTASSTRMLASAQLEFASEHRLRVVLKVAALAALVAVALAALAQFGIARPPAGAGRLEQQNAALRAEIATLRAELEIERATRSALDQQVRELSTEAGDLRSQLEFITAQSSRPRNAGR
jgi:septal ring factor EnvC (AmiA/AmiB activator)